MAGESIKKWIRDIWEERTTGNRIAFQMSFAKNATELEAIYAGLTPEQKDWGEIKSTYPLVKAVFSGQEAVTEIAEKTITDGIDALLKKVQGFQATTPEEAKKKLAEISVDTLKLTTAVSAAEILTAKARVVPSDTMSGVYTRTLNYVGFGALAVAVAHDPVKIAFLRGYQDMLEMTFRNRRPDDFALFQAYRTRELTATKADDLAKLDDTLMDKIEAENQKYYDAEIAKWGYSVDFAGALARSATRTLNFSQLSALARQGLLTRGLAIYSLWGEGLDRTVMKPALDALMQLNEIASYDGFRAQIERGYVEGLVTELELKAYYAKLHIPPDVQKIMLPHMAKLREDAARKVVGNVVYTDRTKTILYAQKAYIEKKITRDFAKENILLIGYSEKEAEGFLVSAEVKEKIRVASAQAKEESAATSKERELTVSQVQQAYEAGLLERAKAQNMILLLGYSLDEAKVLLDLADTRKKLPGASKLKRLPLTDYEKAYKNKLIDQGAVLARMQGEYTAEDIELERKLLEAGKA